MFCWILAQRFGHTFGQAMVTYDLREAMNITAAEFPPEDPWSQT